MCFLNKYLKMFVVCINEFLLKEKRYNFYRYKCFTFAQYMRVLTMFSAISVCLAANARLHVESNTSATFVCNLPSTRDYPSWSYHIETETQWSSVRINWENDHTFLVKQDRLSWADNNRDLVLSAVTREDMTIYQCAEAGVGVWTIQPIVRGKYSACIFRVLRRYLPDICPYTIWYTKM